jgi:hypothetical protein
MGRSAKGDRRREFEQRMRDNGFKQVRLWVPREEGAVMEELEELFFAKSPTRLAELREFFRVDYELFLTDPECTGEDRSYFEDRVAKLA